MNVSTTIGTAAYRKPVRKPLGGGLSARVVNTAASWLRPLLRMPLLLWSLVVAAALLAFFVHLLNEQVLRGQMLREEQRSAATRPASRAAANPQHPGNLLVATRQPMTRP